MKIFYKIIFLFCFVMVMQVAKVNAQQPATWERVMNSYGELHKSQQTSDGGFIAVGYGSIFRKIYLVKFNSFGDSLWAKIIGTGSSVYEGYWVEETLDKGFIIGGIGPGTNGDAYIYKTDPLGNVLWYKTFGGNGLEQCYCVKQLKSKEYILSIRTTSFNSTNDIMLVKTDSMGNKIWSKIYGDNIHEEFSTDLQIVDNSGFILTGWKQIGDEPANLLLIRTDTNGDTLWTKTYDQYLISAAYSVDIANDNGFIIGGIADSINNNEPKAYILKTDSLGNMEWGKKYPTSYNEYCFSISRTNNNSYVFCGMVDSTLFRYVRAVVRTIDNSGNILSENFYSPGTENVFQSVELTKDNGFILCGYAKLDSPRLYIVRTDSSGRIKTVGINNLNEVAEDFELLQNYPNPFNPKTVIRYQLAVNSFVTLKVYDILGNEVATIVNQKQSAGSYNVEFDGSNLSSGIYFYRLEVGGNIIDTKRMVLLK